MAYAHTTHGAADAVNFTDDRAMVHQAATSGSDMSAYMDLGGAAGYRFVPNTGMSPPFGYPKTAEAGHPGLYSKADSAYVGHPNEAEFANYVNMSPSMAPAYPRDYQAMAYPSMAPPSDSGGFDQQYAYPPDYARGPSNASGDLRVAYDTRPSGGALPGQQPPPPPSSNQSQSQPHNPSHSHNYPPPS